MGLCLYMSPISHMKFCLSLSSFHLQFFSSSKTKRKQKHPKQGTKDNKLRWDRKQGQDREREKNDPKWKIDLRKTNNKTQPWWLGGRAYDQIQVGCHSCLGGFESRLGINGRVTRGVTEEKLIEPATLNTFIGDATRLWNRAPGAIKDTKSISSAKKEIKKFCKLLPL